MAGSKKIVNKLKEKQKQQKEKKNKLAEKMCQEFSAKELQTILRSGKFHEAPIKPKYPQVDFTGKVIKFGVISDSHIGSIFYHTEWLKEAFKMFRKENCSFIVHSGDVTEGMSNRPGHVYELTHIGYDQQRNYAIEEFTKYNTTNIKIFFIDGNHDRWYIKSNGSLIVKDIVNELDNTEFIGHDSGDIKVNNAIIRLWHGEDGSSYATSYRLQKVIESITGGLKPDMLIAGHVHKQGYFFDRHIHVLSAGALCAQSSWMKSKRLANHSGFHVVELHINKCGISRCKVEWFPYYG
jgi:predicted phosphodiesterase